MLSLRVIRQNGTWTAPIVISKAKYSRRSDKNTTSYKLIKSSRDALDDLDHGVLGTNPNWELLAPRGFRFYLPGSVGPGWLDASTTSQVQTRTLAVHEEESGSRQRDNDSDNDNYNNNDNVKLPTLRCVAQECPMLLRKGIAELFPGCIDVSSPNLTIVTISQDASKRKSKWSKEMETEQLAKYFVLAASDICVKLKMIGYWADFINPFSGQPYVSPHKNQRLYETDERFRCLGFNIELRNHCRVISNERNCQKFVGSLYTTAPASTDFLKEIIDDVNDH